MAEARGFLGAGDLYINRIIGGVKQGMVGPFECERFEIKANSELRERTSKSRNGYGQVVASAALPRPFDLNITLGEADVNGLSIALLGTTAALNQTAGTTAPAAFVATALDVWLPLSKARVSAVTVTTDPVGTTYDAGDDYIINAELGLIKILSTGAISLNDALLVGFTHGEIVATEILGATTSSIRAEFTLDGVNLADDTPCIVRAWEGVVASDAAVDFLSDQFLTVPLPGRLVTPPNRTSPFSIERRNAA